MEPGPSSSPSVLFRGRACGERLSTKDKRDLKLFARRLSQDLASGASFVCCISDDRHLQGLNCSFLGHDYATDVLSFPSGEASSLGEIAISVERAEVQAAEFGHSLKQELCVLLLHGVLHLMGFDHERDRGAMARAERKWRERLQLPVGLIARSPRRRSTAIEVSV